MHCSSFSKCLAPGYRVGWVSAGRFSQQVQRLKLMTTISPSIPAQAALAAFVEQMKASGFVADAMQRHGVQGAAVAPAA